MVFEDFEFPKETDSIGQRLLRSGVTRRQFLDFCLKLMVVALVVYLGWRFVEIFT